MKVIRDDGLELGNLNETDYIMPKSKYGMYKGSGRYCAVSVSGMSKYFVNKDKAELWLQKQCEGIYPINRINEFLV